MPYNTRIRFLLDDNAHTQYSDSDLDHSFCCVNALRGVYGGCFPTHTRAGCWCRRRQRVNTVDHYTQELEKLNLAIVTEQDKRIPRRRRRPGWGPALTVRGHIVSSVAFGDRLND